MNKVIIFGNNDLAQMAKWYFNHDTNLCPVAFVVDKEYIKESILDNLPVIAYDQIKELSPKEHLFFCPCANNLLRYRKYTEIKSQGYTFCNYVSSKATVLSPVGENCFILEDNTIQPFVEIGNNIIMWSGNHIGHHSIIKDHSFFTSHVVLCGHCTVESFSWFGVNSTIRDNLIIAEGTFIGMASVVTSNTESWSKYMGFPAKKIGKNERD
jgi:sugar O-acyltransferase (sialic acid O-acetyltransferase NeuD family)